MSKTPSAASSSGTPSAGAGVAGKTENVRVAIRIRPFNSREKDLKSANILDVPDKRTIVITDPDKIGDKTTDAKKSFAFDFVYPWE